jgi:ubiquinone/menaquinone biosynthesis C-methylase UbiE
MRDWVSFWDSDHPIYVNARHLDVHYRAIAEDIARLVLAPDARVLDHGCGEALHADKIAAACGELLLCEAAPKVRARLAERFAKQSKIHVIAPTEVERLPAASLDLVIANSLVQYLTRAELEVLLATWRRVLKPGGRLVIADVIGPDQSALADALALLRFAAANGFLFAALLGLARTVFSDYRKLRARLGLAHYSEAEMLALLSRAGLSAERLRPNLGHNQARMAFRAAKPA